MGFCNVDDMINLYTAMAILVKAIKLYGFSLEILLASLFPVFSLSRDFDLLEQNLDYMTNSNSTTQESCIFHPQKHQYSEIRLSYEEYHWHILTYHK